MLKKLIKYTDFMGEEITETFYFNLSKTEVIQWEVEYDEGLVKMLERIIETTDKRALVNLFQDLILKCYGIRSEDGKRFIKNDQLREEFSQHAAFDVLFMEFGVNDEAAADFILGVLPKDLTEGIDLKQLAAEKLGTIQANVDTLKQEIKTVAEGSTGPNPPNS